MRHNRIERIRRQIAAGTYETPERLALAADRMLQDIRRREAPVVRLGQGSFATDWPRRES